MTLAWGLLYKIVPESTAARRPGWRRRRRGSAADRRAAAGLAIDLAQPYLDASDGYQVLWPLSGLADPRRDPLVVRLMAVEDARARAPVPVTPNPLP